MSLSFTELSCLIIRTLVIYAIAGIALLIIIGFILKEVRVWWNDRRRRRESKNLAAYESPIYLANLEIEMIRRRREEAEGQTAVQSNIYEEIV